MKGKGINSVSWKFICAAISFLILAAVVGCLIQNVTEAHDKLRHDLEVKDRKIRILKREVRNNSVKLEKLKIEQQYLLINLEKQEDTNLSNFQYLNEKIGGVNDKTLENEIQLKILNNLTPTNCPESSDKKLK